MEITMATAKVNGSSYTIPPNRNASGSQNNHGSAARTGSSSTLSTVSVSRYNTTVFASTVINNGWADKAVDAGTFAYSDSNGVGMRYTTTLAGVSNNALRSGADVPSLVEGIHRLRVLRTRRFTTAIRANKYNRFTGQFESGYPVVASDSLATDVAATPTRAVPGKIVYKLGQPVPSTQNYSSES
jgi:hypothetical protein